MTEEATTKNQSIAERLGAIAAHLDEAREELVAKDGVIGVGYAPKERGGQIVDGEIAIVAYVVEKKGEDDLKPDDVVPSTIGRIPTDVVEIGSRKNPRLARDDYMQIDWALVHERNPLKDANLEPEVDFDLDNVAILEIDDSFVVDNRIDLVKASKRFLEGHPDIFDFITFFIDTASGLPSTGVSFHSGVKNTTTGINYYAGSSLDRQGAYGSSKLQAVHVISNLTNYTMLQECGHMWCAYVRNRDTATSPLRIDLLIGPTFQGMAHWGRFFDNDHSPMDYDGIDWHGIGRIGFEAVAVEDDFFHYCPLDLYLMGLLPPTSVGSFYVIQNPGGTIGVITGTKKPMTVQNVIWAEGERNPAYPNTQRRWKDAFVVLTRDTATARAYSAQVAELRRKFTWHFFKGTRFLGRIDTALTAAALPTIWGVQVATDDDSVVIGWRTTPSTKGRVNYALSPTSFMRDRVHADSFTTVTKAQFGFSHGLPISGLRANQTYYFEVIAENESGQVDRSGVHQFATRATSDTAGPDISNVVATILDPENVLKAAVVVRWSTDELCDSRVIYGSTRPPHLEKYDLYPTRTHSFRLPITTRFIAVESRDAAGNLTRDDNRGAYYEPGDETSVALERGAVRIDELVHLGDIDGAIEETSALTTEVTEDVLVLPGDDLEAGFTALRELLGAEDGALRIVDRGDDFIELAGQDGPLVEGTYALPDEMVGAELETVLADVVSRIRPGLTLEMSRGPGGGRYVLRRV
jgi:hypothetical protein